MSAFPVACGPARRQPLVDSLRGFALLGILLVNIGFFTLPYHGNHWRDPAGVAPVDQVVLYLLAGAFETKFYLLFSYLFGYSFHLQREAAARAGTGFGARMGRRLLALLVIGAVHAVLLFHGDILATYAVLGAVLLALRDCRTRTLAAVASILMAATALLWGALALEALWTPIPAQDNTGGDADMARGLAMYRGTVASVIVQHVRELPQTLQVVWLAQAPPALAMFCLGLVASRQRLLDGTVLPRAVLRCVVLFGLAAGGIPAIWYALTSMRQIGPEVLASFAAGLLTAPLLTCAYAAGLVLYCQGHASAGRRLAAWLAPAGRMALSNYLGQSLLCSMMFHAWGLRLMGSVTALDMVAIALAIFGFQLVASRWWLERFRYGPVEWLLRAWSNLALPPMRR